MIERARREKKDDADVLETFSRISYPVASSMIPASVVSVIPASVVVTVVSTTSSLT